MSENSFKIDGQFFLNLITKKPADSQTLVEQVPFPEELTNSSTIFQNETIVNEEIISTDTLSKNESYYLEVNAMFDKAQTMVSAQLSAEHSRPTSNEIDDDLEIIEPEETGLLASYDYCYTASDGTKIELNDISGVQVYQNKKTGEIIVMGAKGAVITGNNENNLISVFDSEIKKLVTKNGNDEIYIENSTVTELNSGSDDDKILIKNSKIDTINGGSGNDSIKVTDNSKVRWMEGASGNDTFHIQDSTIGDSSGNKISISGGAGDDFVIVENSNIKNKISAGDGNDSIRISNTKAQEIIGGLGDDTILIANNSNVSDSVNGSAGNDSITVTDSTVKKLDGGLNKDYIATKNAKIETLNKDSEDTVVDLAARTQQTSPFKDLSVEVVDEATAVVDNLTSKYTDRELTYEEKIQALTIEMFEDNTVSMQAQLDLQNKKDGALADGYNFIKQLTDLGVSKSDIEKAINEQKEMTQELKDALKKGDGSFYEVYKKWTGVEFNEENAAQFQETSKMYSLVFGSVQRSEQFSKEIQEVSSAGELLDKFTDYYGDKETARLELNKYIKETMNNSANSAWFSDYKKYEFNENYQLVIEDKYSQKTTTDPYKADNPIAIFNCFDVEKFPRETIANGEKFAGMPLEDLQNKFITEQLDVCGSGNAFQKLVDKYCSEQEGFADAIGRAMQVAGMGMMVCGGVVALAFNPAVGMGIIKAGNLVATTGMFSDNAIELFDGLSSEKGLNNEETWDLVRETTTELALYFSGRAINGVAGNVKDVVLNSTQSKVLALLSEMGTDVTLSLLTDLAITGEVDLTSEGISQLLGILTGVAGAKYQAYTKEAFDIADVKYKSGDIDGTINALKNKGIPEKLIYRNYAQLEANKIIDSYKQTGDYDTTLKQCGDSKILGLDSKNSKQYIEDEILLYEQDKVLKMIEDNVDLDSIYKYIEDSKVLSDADLGYIDDILDGKVYAQEIEAELTALKTNPNAPASKLGAIGRVLDLAQVFGVSYLWNGINQKAHGPRLDSSFENWSVNVGGKEVKIQTDNNLVLDRNVGNFKNLDEIQVITTEKAIAIQDAIKQMYNMGMEVPDEIFVTDLFVQNGSAAGEFCAANNGKLFINLHVLDTTPVNYLKTTIYHEAAHMADFNLGMGLSFASSKLDIRVGKNYVKTGGLAGKKDANLSQDIGKLISNYALTDNQEFVAEVTALIASGTIRLDSYGNFTIYGQNGHYYNADGILSYYNPATDATKLKTIMDLYAQLTNYRLVKFARA